METDAAGNAFPGHAWAVMPGGSLFFVLILQVTSLIHNLGDIGSLCGKWELKAGDVLTCSFKHIL